MKVLPAALLSSLSFLLFACIEKPVPVQASEPVTDVITIKKISSPVITETLHSSGEKTLYSFSVEFGNDTEHLVDVHYIPFTHTAGSDLNVPSVGTIPFLSIAGLTMTVTIVQESGTNTLFAQIYTSTGTGTRYEIKIPPVDQLSMIDVPDVMQIRWGQFITLFGLVGIIDTGVNGLNETDYFGNFLNYGRDVDQVYLDVGFMRRAK